MAALEFALIFPVFALFVFGIINCGLMLWTLNNLQEVAVWTARCAALQALCVAPAGSSCTANDFACYAAAKAKLLGMPSLAASNVVVSPNQVSCSGVSGFYQATITMPYNLFIPGGRFSSSTSVTLPASACYPAQTYTTTPP